MAGAFKFISTLVLVSVSSIFFSFSPQDTYKISFRFPYELAGLSEQQAAAHLLGRFTYGARPGDVDAVVRMGLENWFEQQLDGGLRDTALDHRLSGYDALNLTNSGVIKTFPKASRVLRMAVQEGVIDKSSIDKSDKAAYKRKLIPYMQEKGFKPQKELFRQFINQKILRAAYTNNQLQEVLTDFWFNHFNVSITKNNCAEFIPAFERDVIRPNVTGKFEDLLLATAKSPAMLLYLDNFSSSVANTSENLLSKKTRLRQDDLQMLSGDTSFAGVRAKLKMLKKSQGLNENYAREVMELHTLGVDGGYSQKDVTEAARVLTGWTIYPMGDYGAAGVVKKIVGYMGEDKLQENGFVHDGDFLFAANRHDKGEKTVLGKKFSGNGYQEGVDLLKMIANHPSTAAFISKKIAVRFVSDNPPQSLVSKMAKTFIATHGNIRSVIITMVSSPEFWSKQALREKTKSPFELAISAVRSLNADIAMPYQLYTWVDKMGQKMYFYQAPTGFPDKGQYWINTGALLTRMNFGLALSANKIPGIRIDLLALNKGHEPETAEAALLTYGKIVMPQRDLTETMKRLNPLLHDPELEKKVTEAASKSPAPAQMEIETNDEEEIAGDQPKADEKRTAKEQKEAALESMGEALSSSSLDNNMMSQVVGIIIGSPEFQRR